MIKILEISPNIPTYHICYVIYSVNYNIYYQFTGRNKLMELMLDYDRLALYLSYINKSNLRIDEIKYPGSVHDVHRTIYDKIVNYEVQLRSEKFDSLIYD